MAEINRRMMNRYVEYCLNPPAELIAYRNVAQFVTSKEWGDRAPNPLWRPFLGKKDNGAILPYALSDKALKTKMAILSAMSVCCRGTKGVIFKRSMPCEMLVC